MLNIDIKTIDDTLNEARMTAMDKECGEEELRNMCLRLSLLLANVTGTLVGVQAHYETNCGAEMMEKE